jgi:hypothetical protein
MARTLNENRLENLINQKDLAAFEQAASNIMDDLTSDGFEEDDVRDYLIKKIYSSEEKHAGDIAGYETERGSELSADQAAMYKEDEYIYENAGVSPKGRLITEAFRLQELAGIGNSAPIHPKDVTNYSFQDVDHNDYPDYSDAFIDYAEHEDGTPYTEEELDRLNDDSDLVYDLLIDYLN